MAFLEQLIFFLFAAEWNLSSLLRHFLFLEVSLKFLNELTICYDFISMKMFTKTS